MQNFVLEQKIYLKITRLRDLILAPLLKILSRLGITPNSLSYLGVIFVLLFALFIKNHIKWSLLFLLMAWLCDLLDGSLARYKKVDSDRGKFIDMFCDVLTFAMFIGGLIYGNLLPGLVGLMTVFFLIFSKIFRAIYNSQYFNSSWHFRAVAGFIPNLLVGLLYFFFIIYVLFKQDFLLISSVISSVILFIDMLFFYVKIIYK